MNEMAVFGQMCALSAFSPVHKNWYMHDFSRLFMPPVALRQFYMLPDGSGFFTWAFLSKEIAKGWVERTHKLQAEDWQSGEEMWLIDVIAPFGNIRKLAREGRRLFPKHKVAHGTRSYGKPKVQRVTEWINA